MISPYWSLAAIPALAFAMTAVNAATWRRGRVGPKLGRRVSVLIPARNEGPRIAQCVRAIAASRQPVLEIICFDDDSTDETPRVLAELQKEIPALRVVRGRGLPSGWVGKPHACERLYREATTDVLVFVDADVTLAPQGLERLLSAIDDGADVVTAVPWQRCVTPVERWVVPFLLLSYVSWLPLELVGRTKDDRVVAANGQLLAVRRPVLERLGGFRCVAREIVDDVAFCRQAKRQGAKVVFLDGTAMASCRMYRTAREVWAGFSKNMHEGVGGSLALAAVVLTYAAAFVAPWLALALGITVLPALFLPAAVAVASNLGQRLLLWLRWGQSPGGLFSHPLGALLVIVIALNSLRWSLRGAIHWAGRSYAASHARKGPA